MSDYSLSKLLKHLDRDRLKQIARAHQLDEASSRKTVLVNELTRLLSDSRVVKQALSALSPLTQKIFEYVQSAGGCASSLSLMHALEQEGVLSAQEITSARRLREGVAKATNGSAIFQEALWPLVQYGLLFSANQQPVRPSAENLVRHNAELIIPREVLAALNAVGQPSATVPDDQIEQRVEGSAQNFQRDVYLYWNYLRAQPVTLTATGLVPKRHLVKINEATIDKQDMKTTRDESHAPRLHFIRLMMEETGLIKWTGQQLETTASAQDFFGYTLARRTDRCFEAWKKTTRWNELLHLPIKPRVHQARAAKASQLVVRARQYILKRIQDCASDGWLSLESFISRVRLENYEFLFRRTREDFGEINPYYYYHNPLGWGFPVGEESEGWDKVEREFIVNIVREPLHWLGLVSLGYQNGSLVAFKLTALGAYLFGLSAQPPVEEASKTSGHVVVQPNFQIFALEPITEQTLALLDRFADRVKADKVFEYHLSRESLYRAQQHGLTARDVIAFLEQAATAPLPQNVQRTLEDWGQSYERIVVHRHVSLLHARDPQALDALQSASDAASLLLSRPLPHVAIGASDDEARARLLQALMAQGQLPARESAANPALHDALKLDEEGKITFLHAVPSIFLLQALEKHAERRADGYYLSERVVKSERSAGESTEQIIARWQRWHHGPLPPKLLINIKRWGQFYGRARVQRVIQLPSAELVEAVLNDPEIGPLVKPYPTDPTAIVVTDEQAEHVRALLAAQGILVN